MNKENPIESCEDELQREFGTHRVLLTTSCAKALEVAALLVGLDTSSDVVLPSYTHPATANAFALRGARLVFADVQRETCNIDPVSIEEKLTDRTRCIVPVHYGGLACDMDRIMAIADRRGIAVVEDAAHAFGSRYRDRHLGAFGKIGTISFHETKNVSCIKGGAILINDSSLVEFAEQLVDHGTDRLRFSKGKINRYVWQCVGTDAILAEPLAAMLGERIERREPILKRRKRLWERYSTELSNWAGEVGVQLPIVPVGAEPNAHLFHLVFDKPGTAQRFLEYAKKVGVNATTHFEPLHLSPEGRRMGYRCGDLPVTERIATTLVRLPLDNELEDRAQEAVISAVKGFS